MEGVTDSEKLSIPSEFINPYFFPHTAVAYILNLLIHSYFEFISTRVGYRFPDSGGCWSVFQ